MVAFVLLALVPAACAPLDTGLGHDPCLLQIYQRNSSGIIGRVQGAISTLSNHLDALQSPHYSIDSSQDISETLSAISDFELTLGAQWNLLQAGDKPPEGQTFMRDTGTGITTLQTAGQMLAEAYTDAGNGDDNVAAVVAAAARVRIHDGRRQLGLATESLNTLHTTSPNC